MDVESFKRLMKDVEKIEFRKHLLDKIATERPYLSKETIETNLRQPAKL